MVNNVEGLILELKRGVSRLISERWRTDRMHVRLCQRWEG